MPFLGKRFQCRAATSRHASRRPTPPSSSPRHRPTRTSGCSTSRHDSTHPFTKTSGLRDRPQCGRQIRRHRPRFGRLRDRSHHLIVYRHRRGSRRRPTSHADRTGASGAIGAAAIPCPTGIGRTTSSTTQSQQPTAVSAPPTTRLRRADYLQRRREPHGIFDQMQRQDRETERHHHHRQPARQPEVTTEQRRARAAAPANATDTTSTTAGRSIASPVSTGTRPTPKSGVAQPAPITSAVPRTGSSAAVPGYGVASPSCVQVTTIKASPPQPTSRCRRTRQVPPCTGRQRDQGRRPPVPTRASAARRTPTTAGPRVHDQRDHERHRGQQAEHQEIRRRRRASPRSPRVAPLGARSHAVPMISAGHNR